MYVGMSNFLHDVLLCYKSEKIKAIITNLEACGSGIDSGFRSKVKVTRLADVLFEVTCSTAVLFDIH